MSNLKRFLAMVLVIMMVAGVALSTSALTSGPRFADVAATDVIALGTAVLSDLGIIKGTGVDKDGKPIFEPEKEVTRQQMALFMARIRTATPDKVVADAANPTKFKDVTDPTYYSAINYCVDMEIINGYTDGTFKPTETVTLQEAIKMMITALGYTGLPYPLGYLSKASEPNVDLLVGLEKTSGTKKLTRGEVSQLLYNYFLSQYSKLEVSYNPVSGRYESSPNLSPVCDTFGINKVEGYVTGTPDFGAKLTVYDHLGVLVTLPAARGSSAGTPINPTKYDLTIGYAGASYYNTLGVYVSALPKSVQVMKADLGWGDIAFDTLLGLKATIYINNSGLQNVQLPASKLVGTKKDVSDSSKNVATIAYKTNNTEVNTGSPGNITIKIADIDYGLVSSTNFISNSTTLYNNLYTWNSTRNIAPDFATINTQESTGPIHTLAKFLKEKGYYKLEMVDNGINKKTGIPEVYFIFEPYTIGEYTIGTNSSTQVRLGIDSTQDLPKDYIKVTALNGTTFEPGIDKIYLYAVRQGDSNARTVNNPIANTNSVANTAFIYVYGQLTKSSSNVKAVMVSSNTVVFDNNAIQTFTMVTGAKAINAFNVANSGDVVNTTSFVFYVNDKYDLYKYGTGPVIYAKVAQAATYTPKNYAVIMNDTVLSIPVQSGSSLIAGHAYTVVKAGSSKPEQIIAYQINGTNPTGTVLTAGTKISYEMAGSYYKITAFDETGNDAAVGPPPVLAKFPAPKFSDFLNSADKAYFDNKVLDAVNLPGNVSMDPNTNILTMRNGGTLAAASDVSAILTSNTKVVIYDTTFADADKVGGSSAVSITMESFKNNLLGKPANKVGIDNILVVSNVGTGTIGVASTVIVGMSTKFKDVATSSPISGTPYYIVSATFASSGFAVYNTTTYIVRTAYNTATGASIQVACPVSATVNGTIDGTSPLTESYIVAITDERIVVDYINEAGSSAKITVAPVALLSGSVYAITSQINYSADALLKTSLLKRDVADTKYVNVLNYYSLGGYIDTNEGTPITTKLTRVTMLRATLAKGADDKVLTITPAEAAANTIMQIVNSKGVTLAAGDRFYIDAAGNHDPIIGSISTASIASAGAALNTTGINAAVAGSSIENAYRATGFVPNVAGTYYTYFASYYASTPGVADSVTIVRLAITVK